MRLHVLCAVLVASTCVTESGILVMPSETVASDSVQALAIGVVESLATHHGLQNQVLNRGCNVEGAAGRWLSEWHARGGPCMHVCAELATPWRLRLNLSEPGLGASALMKTLESDLVTVLRSRFGDDAVRVMY
jgi:hypothetical protein